MDWLIFLGIIAAITAIFGDFADYGSAGAEESKFPKDWVDNPTRRREAGALCLASGMCCQRCKHFDKAGFCSKHYDYESDYYDTCSFFEDRGYDHDYW